MYPFRLIHPADTHAAIAAAAEPDTKFIAGGTNLVDLLKMDVEKPKKLVSIARLDLTSINALPDGGIRIGALVPNSDLAVYPRIKESYPVLSQALLSGASAQLRNMATVGGNLLQRTRCPYFYDTSAACNKREPGTGCAALRGYNRSNAILGGSNSCIATHPSDMCVALAALNAVIEVEGTAGKRRIPMRDFHLLPGDTPHIETVLQPGDLITSVELPNLPFGKRSLYLKVRDRASYQFALASAAVALDISGGTIRAARIALGGVGTKPWRALEAEAALHGAPVDAKSFAAAADAALAKAEPHEHNAFKPKLARRILTQALENAAAL